MKFIWIAVVSLVLSFASVLPVAFDSSAASWAELDAKSQVALNRLYENSAAYR